MEGFILSVLSGLVTNVAYDVIKAIAKRMASDCSFVDYIESLQQDERRRAVLEKFGDIVMNVRNGSISINGATIEALKNVCIDHGDGEVSMENSRIYGATIQTGGVGTGTTFIHDESLLETPGTRISVGKGCAIKLSGNASIKQC